MATFLIYVALHSLSGTGFPHILESP